MFEIKVTSCKTCPHIEYYNWGADCRLNPETEGWSLCDNRNLNIIPDRCPAQALYNARNKIMR